jgi:glycine cleavage system H protein
MNAPKDLYYTRTHEWIRLVDEVAVVGITDYAQEQLGDLTFVELPSPDETVSAHDEVAVIESVKAASDVYAPVNGTIIEVNEALNDRPEMINSDPYGTGWMFKIKMTKLSDVKQLLSADDYEECLPESPEE